MRLQQKKSPRTHCRPRHAGSRRSRGFGMLEMVGAIVVVTVLMLAMGQFLVVSIHSGSSNSYRVEVMNHVRARIEELKSIQYDQIGLAAGQGATSGPGYYETDPLYGNTFDADDILLSDSVTLSLDGVVNRTVTVELVDDATDGTGEGDWDGVFDPNTQSYVDYKIVTVSIDATDPTSEETFTTELSTIVIGVFDDEIDDSGEETDVKFEKSKKVKDNTDSKTSSKDKKTTKQNKKSRDWKSDRDDEDD